jgi:hypothetical protein
MAIKAAKAQAAYPRRYWMRSELIFKAVERESNRYLLARLAAKATRILHWPNTRIQDTMNDALRHLSNSGVTAIVEKP